MLTKLLTTLGYIWFLEKPPARKENFTDDARMLRTFTGIYVTNIQALVKELIPENIY